MSATEINIMAIIVAGGSGRRFGSGLPKQYCLLEGRPVVMHTIERMRQILKQYSCEDNIILAIHPECLDLWENLCRKHRFESPRVVFGGDTRWQTVRNSLESLSSDFEGIVLVHDAARPLIFHEVAQRLIDALKAGADGAVPAVAVSDSLRMLPVGSEDNPYGSHAVDRSLFLSVQTPQAFDSRLLRLAYCRPYCEEMTDDASVMELAGFDRIATVEGDPRTLKITHPADIATVTFYLRNL